MEAPDPQEVSDFKFRELKQVPVFSDGNWLPSKAVNLVASSTRFALIFVAYKNGFKAFNLDVILDLDENKISASDLEDQLCANVQLQSEPVHLALSCDEMTLAVCVAKSGGPHLELYNVRAFTVKPCDPKPFNTVQLSSIPGTHLMDFAWNPAHPGFFASCVSDGSVSVFEQTDTSLKIIGTLPQIEAMCICWSPKGKQLVVGKKDGSMGQYKPTLQEAKKIPPPSIFENSVSVLNVLWVQTTLFAAVYVPAGNNEDKMPYFVLISLPKGSPPIFVNYNDVCLGAGDQMDPRYMMVQIPEWNILICASRNSVETAVLNCGDEKQPLWTQWLLEGTGRADLPIIKDRETYPLGVSLIMSAQRTIVISESESYPPMPVIFLLSSAGILCPFHVINALPNAPSLVRPPEGLQQNGERKLKNVPAASFASPAQSVITSTPVLPKGAASSGNPTSLTRTNLFNQMPNSEKAFHAIPVQSIAGQPSITAGTPKMTTPPAPSNSGPSFFTSSAALKASTPAQQASSSVEQVKPKMSSAFTVTDAPAPKQIYTSPGPSTSSFQAAAVTRTARSEQGTTAAKVTPEDAYMAEALIEFKAFEEELRETKKRYQNLQAEVGTSDEKKQLREQIQEMSMFFKELKETMASINSDVHDLKNYSLESFAMLEEAKSRYERNRDPQYIGLLRGRALDPITARSLQEMRKLEQYLDLQIAELNRRLDQDWFEFNERKKQQKSTARRGHYLPSAEVIYRTLLNNNNLIFSLSEQLDRLKSELKEIKTEVKWHSHQLSSIMIDKPVTEDELSALADTLLESKISSPPKEETVKKLGKPTPLSQDKQNNLREALLRRTIHNVRAPISNTLKSYIPALEKLKEKALQRNKTKEQVAESSTIEAIEEHQVLPGLDAGASGDLVQDRFYSEPRKTDALIKVPSASTVSNSMTSPVGFNVTSTILQDRHNLATGDHMAAAQMPITSSSSVLQNISNIDEVPKTLSLGKQTANATPLVTRGKPMFSTPFAAAPAPESVSMPTSNIAQNKFGFGLDVGSHTINAPASVATTGIKLPTSVSSSGVYENITPPSTPQPSGTEAAEDKKPEGEEEQERAVPTSDATPKASSQLTLFGATSLLGVKQQSQPEPAAADLRKPPIEDSSVPTTQISIFGIPTKATQVVQSQQQPSEAQKNDTKAASSITLNNVNPSTESAPLASFTFSSNKDKNVTETIAAPAVSAAVTTAATATTGIAFGSTFTSPTSSPFGFQSVTSAPSSFGIKFSGFGKSITTTAATVTTTSTPISTVASTSVTTAAVVPSQPKEDAPTDSTPDTAAAKATESQSPSVAEKAADAKEETSSKIDVAKSAAAFSFTSLSSGLNLSSSFEQKSESAAAASKAPVFEIPKSTSTAAPTTTPPPQSSLFGQGFSLTTSSADQPKSIFGFSQAAQTTSSTPASTSVATTTTSPFGSATTTTPSIFGKTTEFSFNQQASALGFGQQQDAAGSKTVFGQPSAFGQSSSGGSMFGATTSASSPGGTPMFGHVSQTGSLFGGSSTPATTSSSFFGGAAPAQTGSSLFGASSPTSQTGSLFGGSAATSSSSPFGQSPSTPLGQGASAFKPSFGQSGSSVFGQTPATSSTSPFSQTPSTSSGLSLFGQSGGFFSGLGGQPNPENANKNVFGSPSSFGQSNMGSSNLFGGSPRVTSFGGSPGSVSGSFSAGSGSVAQSGFGAFQQQKDSPGGFGSPATFGSSSLFGGSPKFGSSPSSMFGSGATFSNPLGTMPFGSTNQNTAFASQNSSPTFGQLAQQNQGPTFGSLAQQPAQNTGFGSSAFGSSPSFGNQSPGFGSSRPSGSAFTQWRN